jgi:hypothetical protein
MSTDLVSSLMHDSTPTALHRPYSLVLRVCQHRSTFHSSQRVHCLKHINDREHQFSITSDDWAQTSAILVANRTTTSERCWRSSRCADLHRLWIAGAHALLFHRQDAG